MPKMMLPNTGIETAVSRPVTLDIAEQVMEILQIPKDTRIVFKGDSDSIYQSGSIIKDDSNPVSTAGSTEHVQMSGNSQLTIEVSERFLEEALGTIAVNQPEHTPFFHDDKLGITAKLVYIPTEVSINFKYKSRSRSLTNKIRHDTWARVSNMRDINVHTVTYNVPISSAFINVIKYLHALRENVAGYDEQFVDYFLSYASPSITQISRLEGSNPHYSLQETATRILGMFDFTGAMERAEKDSEGSTYTMEFAYKFTYEKPANQVLKFPVAIHNQLVDQRLTNHQSTDLDKKKKVFYSSSIKHMREWEIDNIVDQLMINDRYVTIPSYDDITYENHVVGTKTIFSAICAVDPSRPKLLLNLADLGNYLFNEEVLQYIRDVEWQYIHKPYQSLLHISYYRNSFLAHHESANVTEDLNFSTVDDLNIRVINRVRLSIAKNVLEVDHRAIQRLARYPNILRKLVLATETNRTHLERLRPRVDITHYFKDLPNIGSPRSLYDCTAVQTNTVLVSGVAADRVDRQVRGTNVNIHNQIYGKNRI